MRVTPRAIVFAAILALGAFLRLWGLGWGHGQVVLDPEEWTWRIIEHLSWSEPVYPGLFHQALYSAAALFHGAVGAVAGAVELLVGQARFVSQAQVGPLFAGRLLVALMATAQIGLAAGVARRCYGGVGSALLAAAFTATAPLLVLRSHCLGTDIALGLMLLVCIRLGLWLLARPGWLPAACLGLAGGLAATVEPLGLAVWPVWALAYGLALARRDRSKPLRYFGAVPAGLVLGLALGLLMGAPGLLTPEFWRSGALGNAFGANPAQGWAALASDNLLRVVRLLADTGGLAVAGLWLAALGLGLRGGGARLLAALGPVPLMAAALFSPGTSVEAQCAAWLPAACACAGWPLVLICRRMGSYPRQVALAWVLGLLLCVTPLWRSLGLTYLFWQRDTFACAADWLERNKPAEAVVAADRVAPLELFPLAVAADLQSQKPDSGYLLRVGDQGLDPPRQLVAGFDLAATWAPLAEVGLQPPWLSPKVRLYGPAPPSWLRRPMALIRPGADPGRRYDLVFPRNSAYGRSDQVMLVRPGGWWQRVLRGDGPVRNISVQLRNLGRDLAVVQVRQGPGFSRTVSIFPGQRAEMMFDAVAWPPMVGGLYPVKVRLLRGDSLLARVEWDPLVLGRQALERGEPELARQLLLRAVKRHPGSFDGAAMLAGALAASGRLNAAALVLEAVGGRQGNPAAEYISLAQAPPGPEWDRRFQALTGYEPTLLAAALGRDYRVDGPPCRSEGLRIPFEGRGYSGALVQGPEGGAVKLWLEDPAPQGHQVAVLSLSLAGRAREEGEPVEIQVWGHGPEGSTLLASRSLSQDELAEGPVDARLPFINPEPGAKLQINLSMPPGADVRLHRCRVSVDLAGHMRGILRWFYDAQGMVDQDRGRYAEAVKSFEAVLAMDPNFDGAYVPLSKALIDAGQTKRAAEVVAQAEGHFSRQPDLLAEVRGLYQALRMDEDAARVEKSLADLRPSLKYESRFEGGLTLLGYDLPRAKAEPGQDLDINYYWRVWAKPPTNYFVFVHLEGQGRIINYDHMLDHGRVGMTALQPGQVVRENYRIKLPDDLKPGQYKLVVGLWDPKFTGKGMGIIEGRGAGAKELTLTTIEVAEPAPASALGTP